MAESVKEQVSKIVYDYGEYLIDPDRQEEEHHTPESVADEILRVLRRERGEGELQEGHDPIDETLVSAWKSLRAEEEVKDRIEDVRAGEDQRRTRTDDTGVQVRDAVIEQLRLEIDTLRDQLTYYRESTRTPK